MSHKPLDLPALKALCEAAKDARNVDLAIIRMRALIELPTLIARVEELEAESAYYLDSWNKATDAMNDARASLAQLRKETGR